MTDGFSKYDIYATSGSAYCYKDTCVLYNRFGIRNAKTLKEIEPDITTIRLHDLLGKPVMGRFTSRHHRYLFGDIYPFAGRYRRESIAKGDTVLKTPQALRESLKSCCAN